MPPVAAIAAPNPSDAYRRRARHLRHVFAGRPGRLQHALKDLADRHDARRGRVGRESGPRDRTAAPAVRQVRSRVVDPPDAVARANAGGTWEFTRRVELAVGDAPLRYSERIALLGAAARMGVDRFQANLIIASVQHRREGGGTGGAARAEPPRPQHRARVTDLAMRVGSFAVVQALLALVVWWAIGG